MNIKSKFKIFPVLLVVYVSVLPLLVVYLSATSPVAGLILPVLFLAFIVFFWMTVFRTRACEIEIRDNVIIIKRYFGLGKSIDYDFDSLDGFITLFESSKGNFSESIFILKNGKRVGSISSFYHINFNQLKLVFKEKLIDLGERESSFIKESAELFR